MKAVEEISAFHYSSACWKVVDMALKRILPHDEMFQRTLNAFEPYVRADLLRKQFSPFLAVAICLTHENSLPAPNWLKDCCYEYLLIKYSNKEIRPRKIDEVLWLNRLKVAVLYQYLKEQKRGRAGDSMTRLKEFLDARIECGKTNAKRMSERTLRNYINEAKPITNALRANLGYLPYRVFSVPTDEVQSFLNDGCQRAK